MCETRRGAVMLIQAGDAEISGALAAGALAAIEARGDGRGDPFRRCAPPSPEGERLTKDQRCVVEAEIDRLSILEGLRAQAQAAELQDAPETRDRQSIARARGEQAIARDLLHVAVGNHKTAEDYAVMRCQAEIDWGEPVDYPTPLERLLDKALGIYGLVVCAVAAAYHAQDRLLGMDARTGGGRACKG